MAIALEAMRLLRDLKEIKPWSQENAASLELLARHCADNLRRRGLVDLMPYAQELVRRKFAEWGVQPDGGNIRRSCPGCGEPVYWLVLRGRVEAPVCRWCGAQAFWLVRDQRKEGHGAVGWGSHMHTGLW